MNSTVKTNEGHSQRSNCRKHHNHVLSSYRYWRCMWLRLSVWVSVCAHTLRCNMELLMATKGAFDCHFFWYWKKKKITLPILLFIYSCCSVVVNRGGLGREPEMEQGLAPSRLWPQNRRHWLAGRLKKLEQIQPFAKTSGLFVQPSCCSLFDVQHSRKRPDPARSSSVRPPWTRHKTTAGHQHCNFLTYNKAISYFLPYKWK